MLRLSKARSHRNQVTRTAGRNERDGCRLKITLPTPRQNCRACGHTIVNWYDAYHVVHEDIVVDIWPIIPRGPGDHGISDLG